MVAGLLVLIGGGILLKPLVREGVAVVVVILRGKTLLA